MSRAYSRRFGPLVSIILPLVASCGMFSGKDDSSSKGKGVPNPPHFSSAFKSIVIFGDSLSDDGNIYFITDKFSALRVIDRAYPVSPIYNGGRFSNGHNWADNMMNDLGLPPHSFTDCFMNTPIDYSCNFAMGGATSTGSITSDNDPFNKVKGILNIKEVNAFLESLKIPMHLGVKEMVDAYVTASNPSSDTVAHSLYVIWVGGNDYLDDSEPTSTVSNIIASIKEIVDKNQSTDKVHFLIPNLPDLGQTPYGFLHPDRQAALSAKSAEHNALLFQALDNMAADAKYKDKFVAMKLDMAALFKQIADSKGKYKDKQIVTNWTDACYSKDYSDDSGKVCDNPDDYLFWDQIHPTKQAHLLLSESAEDLMVSSGVITPQ